MKEITTEKELNEQLADCQLIAEAHKVFNNTSIDLLEEFISALRAAEKFIELTMRDDFLLRRAEEIADMRYEWRIEDLQASASHYSVERLVGKNS